MWTTRLGFCLMAGLSLLAAPIAVRAADEDDKDELRKAANDLKQILIAMHNHEAAYNLLPGAGYGAGIGKDDPTQPNYVFRHLSWRVALLPFIEEDKTYTAILEGKFGEPDPKKISEYWNNADLLKKRPALYAGGKYVKDETKTSWRVFVGNGAAFEKDKMIRLVDFTDGTSNTILVVEAADPVPWTKPDELLYDPAKPLPKLGGRFKEGFLAGMADGSVRIIPRDTDEKTLRALITRAGNEEIDKLPGRPVK